jgi:hypothetical protein
MTIPPRDAHGRTAFQQEADRRIGRIVGQKAHIDGVPTLTTPEQLRREATARLAQYGAYPADLSPEEAAQYPLTTQAKPTPEAWPPPPLPTAGPMTPTRLRECIAIIGWSQRQLAGMIGIDSSRVRRMATGEEPISPTLQAGLEELAEAHARVRLRRES